jgi:hypothetical protein
MCIDRRVHGCYAERDENTQREDFAPSEAVVHSRRIKELERELAQQRHREGSSRGGKAEGYAESAEPSEPVGLEYRILGLTWGFTGLVRSCCDRVLGGEPVEDRSAAHVVVGEVDHWWGLGFGLGRCELPECPVWPRGIEMVQVGREDPA